MKIVFLLSCLARLSDAQVASNVVEGSNMEQMINQLLEMGGGNWDIETILHALCAAYNNPERAVEYLYSGIPATAEIALPGDHVPSSVVSDQGADVAAERPLFGVLNSSPLNMFPQVQCSTSMLLCYAVMFVLVSVVCE